MNPFRGNWCVYVFNTRTMGLEISYEARAYFLRTTLLSLRGYRSKEDLKNLFDIDIQPGKHVRDFVRHLYVYLHCVSSETGMKDLAPNMLPTWLSAKEKITSNESRMYDSYRSYLEEICSLPLDKHAIKLEICIHHRFTTSLIGHTTPEKSVRYKFNITSWNPWLGGPPDEISEHESIEYEISECDLNKLCDHPLEGFDVPPTYSD
jgi:hypothetical protein